MHISVVSGITQLNKAPGHPFFTHHMYDSEKHHIALIWLLSYLHLCFFMTHATHVHVHTHLHVFMHRHVHACTNIYACIHKYTHLWHVLYNTVHYLPSCHALSLSLSFSLSRSVFHESCTQYLWLPVCYYCIAALSGLGGDTHIPFTL